MCIEKILHFDHNRNMKLKKISKTLLHPAAAISEKSKRDKSDKQTSLTQTDAVKALAAIAHGQRLRVFRALVQAGQSGLTPGVMAAMLDMPASSLSFHLKELAHAQLASIEQQGRSLIYRADFSRMTQLMAYLTENCCAADPTGAACC